MTDESDYAGTAPGEWKDANSTAEDIFADGGTDSAIGECDVCGDTIPEVPYVLSSPSDGRETLCMTCWGGSQ